MTILERAKKLRKMIESLAASLTDETALNNTELFPAYQVGHAYIMGDRFRYSDKLYKVLQDHTSQADWTPDTAVSLYVEVSPPDTILVWKQPTGAHDAYMAGNKVHYPAENDPVYVSDIDNNTYPPDVFGWHREE